MAGCVHAQDVAEHGRPLVLVERRVERHELDDPLIDDAAVVRVNAHHGAGSRGHRHAVVAEDVRGRERESLQASLRFDLVQQGGA